MPREGPVRTGRRVALGGAGLLALVVAGGVASLAWPTSGGADPAADARPYVSQFRLPGSQGSVAIRFEDSRNSAVFDPHHYALAGSDAAAWSQSYRAALARGTAPGVTRIVRRFDVTWRGPCDPKSIDVDLAYGVQMPEIPKGVADGESLRRWELFRAQLRWRTYGTVWYLKEGGYRLEHFLAEHRCDPRAALDVAFASVQAELDVFLATQVALDDTRCLDDGECRPKPSYRAEDQPTRWPSLGSSEGR